MTKFGNALTGSFTAITEFLSSKFLAIGDALTSVKNFLKDIVSWINPVSDNFFLKLAFVPEAGFFDTKFSNMKYLLNDKFGFVFQVVDAWSSFSVDDTDYRGIKANFFGKDVYVFDIQAWKSYMPKLKFWMSGVMYMFTGFLLVRKSGEVLGR